MRAWVEPVAVVGASIATIAGVGIVTGSVVWAVLFAVLCFLIIFNI